jgi:hypothetical protein
MDVCSDVGGWMDRDLIPMPVAPPPPPPPPAPTPVRVRGGFGGGGGGGGLSFESPRPYCPPEPEECEPEEEDEDDECEEEISEILPVAPPASRREQHREKIRKWAIEQAAPAPEAPAPETTPTIAEVAPAKTGVWKWVAGLVAAAAAVSVVKGDGLTEQGKGRKPKFTLQGKVSRRAKNQLTQKGKPSESTVITCHRCGHEWIPRGPWLENREGGLPEFPDQCPRCKSVYY